MDTVINGPNWWVGAPTDPTGAAIAKPQEGSAGVPTLQKHAIGGRRRSASEPDANDETKPLADGRERSRMDQ